MTAEQAFWGFPIDSDLYEQAQQLIQQTRTEQARPDQNRAAAKLVNQLTDAGLHAFYRVPISMVPVPSHIRHMADSGIDLVMAAVRAVIRYFFKNRSLQELRQLAGYLDSLLWQQAGSSQHYLAFALEESFHRRARTLIGRVRQDRDRDGYIKEVVDTLCELVEKGVQNYYRLPADLIGLKGLSRKTVDMGMNNAQKGIRLLIQKLVSDLPHSYLVALSHHVESMILPNQSTGLGHLSSQGGKSL